MTSSLLNFRPQGDFYREFLFSGYNENVMPFDAKPTWFALLRLFLSTKMLQKWKKLWLGLFLGLMMDYASNFGLGPIV